MKCSLHVNNLTHGGERKFEVMSNEFNVQNISIKRMKTESRKATVQNHSLLTANRTFLNVAKFKYVGTEATKQNCMHGEIKSRL